MANSNNQFVVCYNYLENRFFEANAVEEVNDPYRRNFYKLHLRLNFYQDDIEHHQLSTDDLKLLCFGKVTKLMTDQNMWQSNHSFYVIEYEIRTILRNNNNLAQQNHHPIDADDSRSFSTDASQHSSVVGHNRSDSSLFTSDDSAYASLDDEIEHETTLTLTSSSISGLGLSVDSVDSGDGANEDFL